MKALKTYDRVVLLTHVPPFEESVLYEGVPADSNWTPHFVGKSTGDAIEAVMNEHPEKELLVLCGHAHWGQDISDSAKPSRHHRPCRSWHSQCSGINSC